MVIKAIKGEDGQGLMEYVLILSLVSIVVIAALTILGLTLENYYNTTVNQVTVGG